ncbi:hypothetical protein [Spirillospora sp. CA-294931]|uniref:hypothetical protein n=1 Tax=Spirillospora sp. CA-294931 TaxID=3240042 RepID=UPI003D926E30
MTTTLNDDRQAQTMPQTLHEAGSVASANGPGGRRRRIQLIDAGWSKNGRYYPPDTLAEAARGRRFPAGTPMFVDHPTVTEQQERPERSVRDLAARLVSDARYENGALVAEAELFGAWRPVINEMADHIGVSIRAAGTLEYGEADGREGPIVTSLTEGLSVDFVTSPARGGKILELIESARAQHLAEARNIGAWLESRLHLSFTSLTDDMYGQGRLSRDERIALSSAIGDALKAFTSRVEADQPQLFTRDLWRGPEEDSGDVVAEATSPASPPSEIHVHAHFDGALSTVLDEAKAKAAQRDLAPPFKGKPRPGQDDSEDQDRQDPDAADPDEDQTRAKKKVAATEADHIQNAPGSPPADTPPTKEEGSMPELTEAEARALQESRDAALAEAEKARNEAAAAAASKAESDLKLARFDATEAARPIAAGLLAQSGLPAAAQGRLITSLVTAATVPLTSDNKLDETVFRASVTEAINTEQSYIASLAEQAGIGTPRGLGETQPTGAAPADAAKTTQALVESYKANGLSERAAHLAATGRPF